LLLLTNPLQLVLIAIFDRAHDFRMTRVCRGAEHLRAYHLADDLRVTLLDEHELSADELGTIRIIVVHTAGVAKFDRDDTGTYGFRLSIGRSGICDGGVARNAV
jgi:hypothetical protein